MNKRGQVTLFIIIAIVIIAAIVFIIFLQKDIIGRGLPSSDIAEIKQYLSDCFETKTKEGIIFLGKQGGYYSLDGVESINFLDEQTAYYWKAEQNLVPSYETTQNELNNYLNNNIAGCFSATALSEYEIIYDQCLASSTFNDIINVEFNCPITIKKGDLSSTIESFSINLEAPVKKILDVSELIINEYAKKPGYVCITCIDEIVEDNDFIVTIVPITTIVGSSIDATWFLVNATSMFGEKYLIWRFVAES